MPNVRIKDQATDTALTTGDYVIVDSESEGTRKYDLGALAARVEALEQGGSGLTQAEKQLILTLFCKAAYAEDDAGVVYDALEALWATTTRTITYNLSHVSSSNTTASVESGQSYTTTLTATGSYTLNTVTVTMGGVDITSTAYSSGTVSIPSVTGNIVITATAVQTAYLVTNNLTNVINSNGATTIPINGSYSASLTASSQQGQIQSVTITMGGIDITSTAYSDGTITIASVTGDIVITANAYLARYNTSDGNITIVNGGWESLNAISGELLSNTANQNSRRSLYVDSGQKAVYRGTQSSYSLSTYYPIPVPSGATSVTVSCDKPEHYNAIGLEKLTGDGYTSVDYHDFSEGDATLTFESDSDLYIMTNSKRANGYNYNTDDPAPSEFTVLFS